MRMWWLEEHPLKKEKKKKKKKKKTFCDNISETWEFVSLLREANGFSISANKSMNNITNLSNIYKATQYLCPIG